MNTRLLLATALAFAVAGGAVQAQNALIETRPFDAVVAGLGGKASHFGKRKVGKDGGDEAEVHKRILNAEL